MALDSEHSQTLASMNSPACQTETPLLPILPMSDIPLIGTPSWAFTHWVPPQPPAHKAGHTPICASNDQPDKRTHAKTAQADVSSRHNTQWGDGEAPETPLEVSNSYMVASGSTEEYDSDDNADDYGDEST